MPFQPRDLIVQAPPLKPKKAQWRVRAPIRWGPYQIPESATTDFASIPKVLWWILPPWERTYVRPAVLHDFLSRPPEDPSLPQVPPVPQHEADRAFRLAMKEEGTPTLLHWVMWALVRWRRFDLFRSVKAAGPWQMLGALLIGVAVLPIAGVLGGAIFLLSAALRLAAFILDWLAYPLVKIKYQWSDRQAFILGLVLALGALALIVVGAVLGWAIAAGWYLYVGIIGLILGVTFMGPKPEEPELARLSEVLS